MFHPLFLFFFGIEIHPSSFLKGKKKNSMVLLEKK
jgi:hypothetical protein